MNLIRRILSTDAILFSRAIASVAALAIGFGAPITDEDVNGAVEMTVTLLAFGNMALAMLERRAVFSRSTHEQDVAAAFAEGERVGKSPNRNTI